MVFQTYPRLVLSMLSVGLMASALSCGVPRPPSGTSRYGDDILVSGSSPMVMDSIPGDAIVTGGDARFLGATGGDYLGAGGNLTIGGRIHGSIRAAGGEIHVTAAADRNATITGGSVVVDSAAVIGRNAYLFGGSVQVNGTVLQSLIASGGTVTLNGMVGRDVEIAGGELHVGPRAQITGSLRYRVPKGKVHIDPAARISGTVTALPVPKTSGFWHILWILGVLVAGVVAVALLPRFTAEATQMLRQQPGRSALVGLGWAILVPIAVVLAAITVIGLPLALLMVAIYLVLLCLGSVPSAVWLGQRILGARAPVGREGAVVSFLVGGLLLLVVGMIPLVGGLVSLIACVLGLGTILLRAWALRQRQSV